MLNSGLFKCMCRYSNIQWPYFRNLIGGTYHIYIYIYIYSKAYVRGYTPKIWPYMVQYLHFRILEFPLILLNLLIRTVPPSAKSFKSPRRLYREGLCIKLKIRARPHAARAEHKSTHMLRGISTWLVVSTYPSEK